MFVSHSTQIVFETAAYHVDHRPRLRFLSLFDLELERRPTNTPVNAVCHCNSFSNSILNFENPTLVDCKLSHGKVDD